MLVAGYDVSHPGREGEGVVQGWCQPGWCKYNVNLCEKPMEVEVGRGKGRGEGGWGRGR